MATALAGGAEAGRALIDRLFWRALLLGLLLLAAGLVTALSYRALADRMGRSASAADRQNAIV